MTAAATTPRLGDLLVDAGLISRVHIETLVKKACGRLGHSLHMHGLIDGRQLALTLATQKSLPRVNLKESPPQPGLFSPRDQAHYHAHRFVPYARDRGTITLATDDPNDALLQFARAHYGCPVRLAVITAREWQEYWATYGATTATRNARLALRRRYRHLVADRMLMAHQWRGLGIILLIITLLAALPPGRQGWHLLLIACNLFYLTSLATKLLFYYHGAASARTQAATRDQLKMATASLPDASLPIYSILVPLYREKPSVIARLMTHLDALDYPRDRLDIKLICEADDAETMAAIKALCPPATMEIIAVPPALPRTKPKACNVALAHVRGEYLVIYDAEDAPDPDQLRLAVAMFRQSPADMACMQASLNYYNREDNLLTRMFSLEYGALFNLLLPALIRLGMPMPLGGTSNHLRTDILQKVGGWDAFNVTEDADLGIRLSYFGYRSGMLPSLTREEAPRSLAAWLKQRTRWIKGYIQTWLVYTRDRAALKEKLGFAGYYGFQFFIAAPALTFLLAPIFWMVFIVSLSGLFSTPLPAWMQLLCLTSFAGATLSHWLFARKVLEIEHWPGMHRALWLYPLYWCLHSLAAGRALWQLITAPHYWEKTTHGLTQRFSG